LQALLLLKLPVVQVAEEEKKLNCPSRSPVGHHLVKALHFWVCINCNIQVNLHVEDCDDNDSSITLPQFHLLIFSKYISRSIEKHIPVSTEVLEFT
jgi:hypothetical protein